MDKIIAAIDTGDVDFVLNRIPGLDKEMLGETLRAVMLKRGAINQKTNEGAGLRAAWAPVVKEVVDAGARVMRLSRYPDWSALVDALRFDDSTVLEALLSKYPANDAFLFKIFGNAVMGQKILCLDMLLSDKFRSRIDIDAPAFEGMSALVWTLFPQKDLRESVSAHRRAEKYPPLSHERFIIARQLVRGGANPNQLQPFQPKPIILEVIRRGMDREALMLLRNGADYNFKIDEDDINLLCLAFLENCPWVQEWLMARADIDFKYTTPKGGNLAHYAAMGGAFDKLDVLKQKGVDICAPGAFGSILKFGIEASWNVFMKMVEYCKQDTRRVVDFQMSNGWAALHVAANARKHWCMTTLFNELHANPNIQTEKGVTPLMLAARQNDLKGVQLLLEQGADLYATDKKGRNLLYYAISERGSEVFEFLLSKGLKSYGKDSTGSTLIHAATAKSNAPALEHALKLEPDWNAVNDDGKRALDLLNPRRRLVVSVWENFAPQATQEILAQKTSCLLFKPAVITPGQSPEKPAENRQRGN